MGKRIFISIAGCWGNGKGDSSLRIAWWGTGGEEMFCLHGSALLIFLLLAVGLLSGELFPSFYGVVWMYLGRGSCCEKNERFVLLLLKIR